MKTIPIILLMSFLLFCSSCVKDLDFKQAEDLELSPDVLVSLIKFSKPATSFISGTTELLELKETSVISVFDSKVAQNDLQKIKIEALITNEFDRVVTLQFTFLDASKTPTYTFQPIEVSSSTNDFSFSEEIVLNSNRNILTSKFMEVTITLSSGSPLQIGEQISMKSNAILSLKI